ncbi:hypothetical protein KW531_00485 [Vibrio fluvialis]|nr:hypothetical protein [Vibrio fluvialis]
MNFILFKLKAKAKELLIQNKIYNYNIENKCNINLDCNITGGLKNLQVGKGTVINSNCNIRNKSARVIVGENCLFARNVTILTSQYDLKKYTIGKSNIFDSVSIGDNVWIGTNVVIMPGVHIGNGAVVGAQSVVTKDIAPMTINVGIPSKKISLRKVNKE